jgi:hypothetical protein
MDENGPRSHEGCRPIREIEARCTNVKRVSNMSDCKFCDELYNASISYRHCSTLLYSYNKNRFYAMALQCNAMVSMPLKIGKRQSNLNSIAMQMALSHNAQTM